jgi:hypothetical protein
VLVRHGHHVPAPSREKPWAPSPGSRWWVLAFRSREPGAGQNNSSGARLDALGPAPRAELLHVLRLPDFDRADAIGSYWGNPKTRGIRGTTH